MKNRVVVQRLGLLLALTIGIGVAAGCTPALGANASEDGAGQGGNSGTDSAPENLSMGNPATEGTGGQGGDHPVRVSAIIQAITGNTVTVNGVQYTVSDPSQLTGLKVGDMVTLTLKIQDGGTLVVATITPGGSEDNQGEDQSTQEATESSTAEPTEVSTEDGTAEPTEVSEGDNSGTPEPTEMSDGNGGMSTQEPTEVSSGDHGSSTPEPTEMSGDNGGGTPEPTEVSTENSGGHGGSHGGGGNGGDSGGD